MINIDDFLEESKQKLEHKRYELDIEKLKYSFKNYKKVLESPNYSKCIKNNKYKIACIIPFNGRKNIVKFNVESLNKQSVKPAIILSCSNISDYNFSKKLELKYDNVFTFVTLNYPLGKKFYDTVKFAQSLSNLKYLMILGSDDLLSFKYIEKAIIKLESGYDLIGLKKWLMCTEDYDFYKLSYKNHIDVMIGGGKIYSKTFLDSVNWDIFNKYRPIHLDVYGEFLFNNSDFKKYILNNKEFILSIKGEWDCINTKEMLLKANNRLNIDKMNVNLSNKLINYFNINKDIFKKDKLKICILTTLYLRHDLNIIVLNYYNNLKKSLSNLCEIELIACGSNDSENERISIENDFKYINHSNNPLSQKHNALFIEAKKYNPNFTILIGSDDFLCENVIYNYIKLYNQGIDYSGILDFKFIDSTGFWYWPGYNNERKGEPVGGGRYFSDRLLHLLNWMPWNNHSVNKGLDFIVNNEIKKIKTPILSHFLSCEKDNVNLITIRSDTNITNMSIMRQRKIDYNPLNLIVIDKKVFEENIKLNYKNNLIKNLNPKKEYDEYSFDKENFDSTIRNNNNNNNNKIVLKSENKNWWIKKRTW